MKKTIFFDEKNAKICSKNAFFSENQNEAKKTID